jgi:hypothetical protein
MRRSSHGQVTARDDPEDRVLHETGETTFHRRDIRPKQRPHRSVVNENTGAPAMARHFLPTLFGIIAPLAGSAWLVFLH